MRPGQQNKRGRGRNNNNNNGNNNNNQRKGGNPLTRTYDSSGPDVKIRGTAQHIAEKYATLARDAQSAGDRVIAENYLQHAEHYYRIIAAAQAQMQDRFAREERSDFNDRDGFERDQDDMDGMSGDEGGHEHDHAPTHAPAPAAPRVQAPAAPRPPAPARPRPVAVEPAAVEGTGPQPVIEGTPVEVSLEDEEVAESAAARTPRRRNVARPRRTRRGEAQAGGDETPDGDDKPALEPVSSE